MRQLLLVLVLAVSGCDGCERSSAGGLQGQPPDLPVPPSTPQPLPPSTPTPLPPGTPGQPGTPGGTPPPTTPQTPTPSPGSNYPGAPNAGSAYNQLPGATPDALLPPQDAPPLIFDAALPP